MKPASFSVVTRFYKSFMINRVSTTITIRSDRVNGSLTISNYRVAKYCAIAMLKSAGYTSPEITGTVNFNIMGVVVSREVFEKDVTNTLEKQKIRSLLAKFL